MTEAIASKIFSQVVDAVNALLEFGIVHRYALLRGPRHLITLQRSEG